MTGARLVPNSWWHHLGSPFPKGSADRIRRRCSSPAATSFGSPDAGRGTSRSLMPHGVAGVAVGMRHDWPLRYPDLFASTIDGWLAETGLPVHIELLSSDGR